MSTYRIPVLEQFSWQPPIIQYLSNPPGSPVKGERYLVLTTGTGVWSGHNEQIATYNGTAWIFDTPATGWCVYDQYVSYRRVYSGSAWVQETEKPTFHQASHQSGQGDELKLDTLGVPTDVTTLNATTGLHGLLPKLGGGTTNFLRADGTWATPPGTGGSVPTGTGFRHITSGVEDAAAKLVANADVDNAAAIAESKLALNYATHANTNDPTTDQKAALAGTSGTPSVTNKYVTNQDGRIPAYDTDYKCLLCTI